MAKPTQPRGLRPGTLLADRYEVGELLGSGGMGSVYSGRHTELDRPVAIKLIGRGGGGSDEQIQRFQREARLLARLSHPNIVAVHDFGRAEDGALFLVLERVEGRDLHDVVKTRALPWEEAASMGLAVASALAYAHGQGVLHRDLKPSNIMCLDGGAQPARFKLIDFGLARLHDVANADLPADGITESRYVIGTPGYIAPEYALSGNIGPAGDFFALGVTLFELLAAERPFGSRGGAANPQEAQRLHRLAPDAPSALRELIVQLLHPDPAQRPGDPVGALTAVVSSAQHPAGASRSASPAVGSPRAVPVAASTHDERPARKASSQERSSRKMIEVPGGLVTLVVGGGQVAEVRVLPFAIDKHLVTQREYLRFVEATGAPSPRGWPGGRPRSADLALPVVGVAFEEAEAFAAFSARRLPTEAEWDLAARGLEGLTYPWGERWMSGLSHPTHDTPFERRAPGPIGVFSPQGDSPFGLSDLLQVWEWVVAPYQAQGHMVRGGPWRDLNQPAQLSNQSWEDEPVHDVGFRLAG